MAVETDGRVRMRGDTGPGVAVRVLAEGGRLRLTSGDEVVGDWSVGEIGISVLNEGFAIKAEGEEFLLRASLDAELAEELGVAAAAPRLARKVAALHNPEVELPSAPQDLPEGEASGGGGLVGIAYALSGVLVIMGGALLSSLPDAGGGGELWTAFVIGGTFMVAVALALSLGVRGARVLAYLTLAGVVALFVVVASSAVTDVAHLTAYGFVAGGLVVGVAVLFGGDLGSAD